VLLSRGLIPTLAVLVGILTNAMQMSAMNSGISAFESRVDARFNNIDIDNRVTRIEAKLDIG